MKSEPTPESRPPPRPADPARRTRAPLRREPASTPTRDPSAGTVVLALRELVAALDRRVRRLEDAGETAIVREACVLRQEAVTRIEALTGADGGGDPADRAAAAANPTGDGAPSPTATGLRPTTTDPPEHAPPEPASPDGARS